MNGKPTLIKLCSWNVAGLSAFIKNGSFDTHLKVFLPCYTRQFMNPDIMCLSETRCQVEQINTNLRGYKVIWNDCLHKADYAGVAILSKFEPISTDMIPLGQEVTQTFITNTDKRREDNTARVRKFLPHQHILQ